MPAQIHEPQSVSTDNPEAISEKTREIPKWALLLGLVAFLVFNAMFLIFAMSLASGNPG